MRPPEKRKPAAGQEAGSRDSRQTTAHPTAAAPDKQRPPRYLTAVNLLGVDRVWAGYSDEADALATRDHLRRRGHESRVLVLRDTRAR